MGSLLKSRITRSCSITSIWKNTATIRSRPVSNWSTPANFKATVEFCRKRIGPARLKGFLQTPWKPTLESCRKHHMEAIDQAAKAIASYAAPGG